MPFKNIKQRTFIENHLNSNIEIWKKFASDLYSAKDIVFFSYILAILMGFLFMTTMLLKSLL